MFWQSFCQLKRNCDDGREAAEEQPRWQVNNLTGVKSGLFSGQNVWLSKLQVLTLQVSVFLAV